MLYGGLGRFADGGGSLLRPRRPARSCRRCCTDGLRSAGRYVDDETNDARLTIAVARAAARAGARIATRVEVRALRLAGRPRGRRRVRRRPRRRRRSRSTATCVVNATGPWVDDLRRMADPAAPRSLRFAKGAHLIVRLDEPWEAALTTPLEGGRVQFANPWEGALLVGTTDEPFEGDPRDLEVTAADIEQIVRESRASIEPGVVEHDRILSSFAGVRVLPQGEGETPSARRETVFERGESGMLSIAGGKFTTFRRIALDALERLRGDLGLRALDRAPVPLPGAADPGRRRGAAAGASTRRSRRRARGTSRASTAATRSSCSRRRATSPRCSSRSRRALPRSPRRCAWAREQRVGADRRRRARAPHDARRARPRGRGRAPRVEELLR